MTVPGVPFYGINRTKDEACGIRCYPSHGGLPCRAGDGGDGSRPRPHRGRNREVLSVPGLRAVVTPGTGNEAGVHGPEISDRIKERVLKAGIAMIGPNCMGVATPGAPSPWIGSLHKTFIPGPVATLAHSGSIGEILVSLGPGSGFAQ